MKKKLFILFIVVLVGLICLYSINKHFKIIDLSSISVSTDDNLQKDKVKIERGYFNGSRENDKVLFTADARKWTVFNRHRVGLLHTDYGENDFLITYDNKYYLAFRHFITYSRHQHSYNFKFSKHEDSIYIHADILGGDEYKFTRPMQLISDAYKLQQGNQLIK